MDALSLAFQPGMTDPLLAILYDVTAMTGVETYSDLEYTQLDVSVGGTYAFTDAMSLNANAGYALFDDSEPYVDGDEDGDSYYGSLGVAYRF